MAARPGVVVAAALAAALLAVSADADELTHGF
jgi:hypothetical protein